MRALRQVPLSAVAALLTVSLGCQAQQPALTDAAQDVVVPCTPYADLLVAFAPAAGDASADGDAALGAPDDVLVELGPDDALTVGFIGLGGVVESDAVGDDLEVIGTLLPGTEVTASLSIDGEQWEIAGTLGPAMSGIDLAGTETLSAASYVRLVGVSGVAEIDALFAVAGTCP